MPGSFAELKDAIRPSYSPSENVVDGFYVPLLSRARAYDRVAGYFTSWGLAVAARGLADFVVGTGVMRLIVGAQLEADDLAALEDGAALELRVGVHREDGARGDPVDHDHDAVVACHDPSPDAGEDLVPGFLAVLPERHAPGRSCG